MRQNDLVSVLMPVYNAAPYLDAAIESVLQQTYHDFEFIIVDDGSTDGSLEICRAFAAKDNRIRLVARENRGIVPTRNELLDMAAGRYCAIMDADDISFPERLARQRAFLAANEDCFIVGCRDLLIDPDGMPIMTINHNHDHDDVDRANLGFSQFQTLNAYMCVTDRLREAGGYRAEVRYAEDRDVFLRMAEIGRIKVLPETLYGYRQHFSSTCRKKAQEVADDVYRVVRDAHQRRNMDFTDPPPGPAAVKDDLAAYQAWAWQSLGGGNIRTAWKYALKLLGRAPLSPANWKLAMVLARTAALARR